MRFMTSKENADARHFFDAMMDVPFGIAGSNLYRPGLTEDILTDVMSEMAGSRINGEWGHEFPYLTDDR